MADVCQEFEHAGVWVRIHWDEDGGSFDPRTDQTNATTILFNDNVQRFSSVGDDSLGAFDFEDGICTTCAKCEGQGEIYNKVNGIYDECPRCEGEGDIYDKSDSAFVEFFKGDHNALHSTPLYCQAYRGGSPDTNIRIASSWTEANGVALILPKHVEETGIESDRFDEAVKAEIREYNAWLAGEVYFFTIHPTEKSAELLDSCYGFIGLEWAIEAAKESAKSEAQDLETKRDDNAVRSNN